MKNKIFYYEQDLVLNKDYKDEEKAKISKEIIIDDLISIYGKFGENSPSLYLDNNHLKMKIIKDSGNNGTNKKRRNKRKKKRKKII